MTTLDYASTRSRAPFPKRLLAIPLVCLILNLIFYFVVAGHYPGYLGTPTWLRALDSISQISSFLGVACCILALAYIPFRCRGLASILGLTAVLLAFGIAIPLAQLLASAELRAMYHHLPYLRLVAYARGLTQSAVVYASDHNDNFPPHLATLMLAGQVLPKELIDFDLLPYVPPTPLPPESAWPTIAADVEAHSIFIYTGADLSGSLTVDPAIIINYTKPRRVTPGHRILAFADGHAQLIPDADIPKYFTASNAARAKLHLPPFTLDGPAPTAPTK